MGVPSPASNKGMFVIRDANGNLGGSGATAGGVSLVDATSFQFLVQTGTLAASTPPYQVFAVTSGIAVVNPNDVLQVNYVAPTGATATATGFTIDVFGYYQQGI